MRSRLDKIWHDWRGFLLFIAIMLIFRSAIADWNHVPSGSMIPSILVGDRIVVDKLAYDLRVPFTLMRIARWSEPQRGDVVTFPSPEDERLLVKRVVGIPGDVIELDNNELIINGTRAGYVPLEQSQVAQLNVEGAHRYRFYRESILGNERYIMLHKSRYRSYSNSFKPTRVPPGHFLMMGDNRDNSRDSRVIGFIERERILGRAKSIAFSFDYENYYIPRMNRFFEDLP
ncbi:MAG: signal peptidase I [Gammaproteobacteria bacterium]|nr:signal peptidase I [Gammaproteobacteria bacterium]MCZ6852352.1 signal peptidase I [Gammaproteobacteria bacterium]